MEHEIGRDPLFGPRWAVQIFAFEMGGPLPPQGLFCPFFFKNPSCKVNYDRTADSLQELTPKGMNGQILSIFLIQLEISAPRKSNLGQIWYRTPYNQSYTQYFIVIITFTWSISKVSWQIWPVLGFPCSLDSNKLRNCEEILCSFHYGSIPIMTHCATEQSEDCYLHRPTACEAAIFPHYSMASFERPGENLMILPGDPSCLRQHFVDFNLGIPPCGPHVMPILAYSQLSKHNQSDNKTFISNSS